METLTNQYGSGPPWLKIWMPLPTHHAPVEKLLLVNCGSTEKSEPGDTTTGVSTSPVVAHKSAVAIPAAKPHLRSKTLLRQR